MKINFFFFTALTLLTLHSCQPDQRDNTENDKEEANTKKETPVKMLEYLVGEWQADDAAPANQGNGMERLTFTEEARYIVHAGNEKTDSGAYRMNEQLRNLYLESDANKTPREFEIDLKEDVLTLKPRTADAGQASYTFKRVGPPTNTSNQ